MITKETIERFFSNSCTSKEIEEVIAYFDANPDVFNIIEREWNEFQSTERLSEDVSRKIWKYSEESPKTTTFFSIYLKRIAIAASFILLISSLWYLIGNRKDIATNQYVQFKREIKTVTNFTKFKKSILLSDSSIVELMPNSTISYIEKFDSLKREVRLNGEAWFKVTKDYIRPFSVIGDSIITTVLGTKFTVKSYDFDNKVQVLLHEGKVKVTPNGSVFKGNQHEYFLNAGDVLIYNKQTSEVLIKRQQENSFMSKKAALNVKNYNSALMQGENWYMFSNQPLSDVIVQLELFYNTNIGFNKYDIKGLTFIGKIDRSDSLENILNSIASLNNLRLTKREGSFWLSKK